MADMHASLLYLSLGLLLIRLSQSITITMNNNYYHQQQPQNQSRILVMGSCGMDRLLTVSKYPQAEEKVRTTSVVNVGGGNAANVAHTAALLLKVDRKDSDITNDDEGVKAVVCPKVQLYTKVGDDDVGDAVKKELENAGVDVDGSCLFRSVPGTTTGFTTVIVGTQDNTRTCIHTPGSCGEWNSEEVAYMVEDDTFWKNVCHFHSDSRQTDAALLLAREAKRRNILVSLDVEKDRETSALDELLIVSDIIFTNALQIDEYLSKLNHQAEQREGRMPIHEATIAFEGDDEGIDLDKSDGLLKDLVDALRPSTYFTRWFGQKDKEVVITKGNKGSIHVVCRSISIESGIRDDYNGTKDYHEVRLSCPRKNDDGEVVMTAKQRFVDPTTSKRKSEDSQSKHRIVNALYEIRSVGIWPDITSIVDTTGAGDAFLGGYLSALWWSRRHGYEPTAHDCLRVGTWVAAKKIEGPGSRTTLPTRDHLDVELGPAPKLAFSTLRKKIGPFGGKSLKPTQVKAKS